MVEYPRKLYEQVEMISLTNIATYIVFTDGSMYYVKNGLTGAVEYSDSNAANAIQYAINQVINRGGGTIVLKGEFYFPTYTEPTQYGEAMIGIPASNVRLRIVGDEAVLHLPQNNYTNQMWLFTVSNQSLDTGAGRITFENLYVVDDVNTGSYSSNFLVTSSKGFDVEVRNCVFRFNSLGGFGIWLNNGLGARISGCRFLEVGGRSAVLFDSVDLGKVSDCLFVSRKYGRIGTAISVGTGNIVVENSEFYGLDTVFHFTDVDGETTLSASNNIFGVERRFYFTMPDGSAWIMLPSKLININNVSNLRINIDNSYIASENFIEGDSPTGRVINIYVSNSILIVGYGGRVAQNPDGGFPAINTYFDNCQFGYAGFTKYPIIFAHSCYVRNSRIYAPVLYDGCYLAGLSNHYIYGSISREYVFENNIIYVKNTSSTSRRYTLVAILTEDPRNIFVTARFRNNKIVLDGSTVLYFGLNDYTSNSAYAFLDLLMYGNEIIYLNGASFGGETYGIGNYTRRMIRRNIGYVTENGGVATFSGDGTTTQFKIAHGLASTPSKVIVTPASANASGSFYVTADSTYIYVNYSTAPPTGTNNDVLYSHADA